MKRVLFLILIAINLYSNVFNDKNIDEKIKIQKDLKLNTVKKIFGNFIEVTGESKERFNQMINTSYKNDMYFLKGIHNLLSFYKTSIKIYDPYDASNKKYKIKLHNYKKAIFNFYKSASLNHNILSAYEGASIIEDRILIIDNTGKYSDKEIVDIVNKAYPLFLKLLREEGYCYGYTMTVNYYDFYKIPYYNKSEKKLNSYIDKGFKICKRQYKLKKIPKYLLFGIAKEKSRHKALKILKERYKKEQEKRVIK